MARVRAREFVRARSFGALDPGGVLALFGAPTGIRDPRLRAAVEGIEQRVPPGDDSSVMHPWSLADLAVEGLSDAVQRDLPRVITVTITLWLARRA